MITQEEFWNRVNKSGGCWEWTRAKTLGYGRIGYRANGKAVARLAHRLSWEFANGPIPDGMCVLHKCDNPSCVRPDHLFLGTKKDNTRDMMSKGRNGCGHGENTKQARLTAAQVRELRRRYVRGIVRACDLAKEFGVHTATVNRVVANQSWKHLAN